MKKITVLLMITVFALFACGGGGSNNGTDPQITNVEFCKVQGGVCSDAYVFDIGDKANMRVYCDDPDLDIKRVCMDEFYPASSTVPYNSVCSDTPSQASSSLYFYLLHDVTVTGPTGAWHMEIYLIDAEGNESNTFRVNYIIQ